MNTHTYKKVKLLLYTVGMQSILESLIKIMKSPLYLQPEKWEKRLIKDLTKALTNYNNRYDD